MPLESQCRWNHHAVKTEFRWGEYCQRKEKRKRKGEGRERKKEREKKEGFILRLVDVLRCPLEPQNAQVIKIIAEITIARRRTVLRRPSGGAPRPRGILRSNPR